ncbi:MAG TPA: 1-acyl-sn-glycerol-3-phosphate acyltransferase [Saprospiraceae bacterium]|nr:MAG: phospholipid/glycerol acyltransferase [Candidatus Parvibacillus calidus]HMZ23603.1 1-acyl-sn-glycerol-3-phosphate acyltransferase [Saprospiraceae bacterium]HNH41376.1 1-acyl-sn-glycerol-3-phosphate acyltransferase [Saprospiraceae bacterium]HNQ42582.1 1-acyl-sn-glycerol-3-phosphate acyltransferase [Saprospiraceae bacterium]HPE08771.1 1-acyl-sn-glycerol-3-phosphate acyltransferase [Saprospiraceae bacterium]
MHRISAWILKMLGWKIVGWDMNALKKYVLIAMPHTSNLDFPLGLLVRSSIKLKIHFVGKSGLFRWPFGFIFRRLGGYPVDRSRSHNYVEAVAAMFKDKDLFRLTIAPEGTRSKVDRLKTGFYYIAQTARVPIVMVAFDYKTHEIRVHPPIDSSISYDDLYQKMKEFFRGVEGRHPEKDYEFE